MKKMIAVALTLCLVSASVPAFAETHDGTKKKTSQHKVHTKAHHKMHTKSTHGHKVHIKATPGMPKTGMGGASN